MFLVDYKGYVIECVYSTKVLPSIEFGLEIVCFLKKVKSVPGSCFLMYLVENQENDSKYCSYKTGEIMEIDPLFKKCLSNNLIDPVFPGKKWNMSEVLPEWNMETEKLCLENADESFKIIDEIKVVDQIELRSTTFLKIMRVDFQFCEKTKNEHNSSF